MYQKELEIVFQNLFKVMKNIYSFKSCIGSKSGGVSDIRLLLYKLIGKKWLKMALNRLKNT